MIQFWFRESQSKSEMILDLIVIYENWDESKYSNIENFNSNKIIRISNLNI